jgi:hypothetical protein
MHCTLLTIFSYRLLMRENALYFTYNFQLQIVNARECIIFCLKFSARLLMRGKALYFTYNFQLKLLMRGKTLYFTYNFQLQIVNAKECIVFYLQLFESQLHNLTVQFLKVNKASAGRPDQALLLQCSLSSIMSIVISAQVFLGFPVSKSRCFPKIPSCPYMLLM